MEPKATVKILKRLLDIAAGVPGTAAFLLAYPILATLIKMESPGPTLYLQRRVGLDKRARGISDVTQDARRLQDVGGAVFTIFKFRTMHLDAEKNGPRLCDKQGDPRITRIGRFLRSTHLDELPQFWNVLKGEMSFIGPRPERPHFTVDYALKIPLYFDRTRHTKPGITGLSQITLGYDDSLDSVIRKTRFDLAYRASFTHLTGWLRMEAWIILNTLRYLWQGRPLEEGKGLQAISKILPAAWPAGRHNPQPQLIMVRNRGVLTPTMVLTKGGMARNGKTPGILEKVRPLSPVRVANFLTIDVECWFHAHNLAVPRSEWENSRTRVVANVRQILDILSANHAKATFFILGWVADRFPEVVQMIDAEGHEIGTHGYFHEKVTDLTPYQFEKDLEMSLNALAKLTGQRIIGHRASNFSIVESTLWALEILARYDLEYDSSIFPIARKRYGIAGYPNRMPHTIQLQNGASIREFPLSTLELGDKCLPISGGGYLRLYPYKFTEMFIRNRNSNGAPAMVYFHPWELDLEQERRNVGRLKSFQHYVNLNTTAWKINRLLETFRFTPVKENLNADGMRAMLAQNPVEISAAGDGLINPSRSNSVFQLQAT